MIFNDKETIPQVTSTSSWLLRHIGHSKIQKIVQEETHNAPDVRMIFCQDCKELLIVEFIIEELCT